MMQYTDRYYSYKSPYDLSLVSGRMSIMSSTVQFNFLQILTSISIDTNSFLESFAGVLVPMPTSFANLVLHCTTLSQKHSIVLRSKIKS